MADRLRTCIGLVKLFQLVAGDREKDAPARRFAAG